MMRWCRLAIVTGIAWLFYHLTQGPETVWYEHLFQAQAWLRGHWYIDPTSVHEQIVWQGHNYILHPPFAAMVMLAGQMLHYPYETHIAVMLGALNVGLTTSSATCSPGAARRWFSSTTRKP